MKKNRKVKMTFNVPIEVQRQIKNYVEDLGYKSEWINVNKVDRKK